MTASSKERMQKNITLCYYNRYLRDHGVISEQEYLRLSSLINSRYPIPDLPK